MLEHEVLLLNQLSATRPYPPGPAEQEAAVALIAAGLAAEKTARDGRRVLSLTPAGAARKKEQQEEERARKVTEKEAEKARKAQEKEAEKARIAEERAAEKARAAAARVKDAPRGTAQPGAITVQDLAAFEDRLFGRIQALLAQHAEAVRQLLREDQDHAPAAEHAAPAMPDPEVAQRMLQALGVLDAQRRYDGLVPLRALRPALPGVPRQVFDATLFDLERQRRVDLKIANDPTAVPEPEAGIRVDGRGLVYYVGRR